MAADGRGRRGTHERLKAHLCELADPKIKEHRGRIVKNTGDGMLAEFARVIDALRCGTELQADPDADSWVAGFLSSCIDPEGEHPIPLTHRLALSNHKPLQSAR